MDLSTATPNLVTGTRITPGAARMRASRERRRSGMRCLTLDVKDSEIRGLVDIGLLRAGDQDDRFAIAQAIYGLFDTALGGAQR